MQDLATELLAVELGVFQASVTRMRLQVLVADKDRAFYEERQKAINSEVQVRLSCPYGYRGHV